MHFPPMYEFLGFYVLICCMYEMLHSTIINFIRQGTEP